MRIVTHNLTTNIAREKIWAHYSNPETWPKWYHGIEWIRFDGPFATGTWGIVKIMNAAPFRFCLVDVMPGDSFSVLSQLPNAEMLTHHLIKSTPNGKHVISFEVHMIGPLAPLFAVIIGHKIKANLPFAMRALDLYAERDGAAYETIPFKENPN